MLYSPEVHEPLTGQEWDEGLARAAIARVIEDAEQAFDAERLWPMHPMDAESSGDDPPEWFMTLYIGASGMLWGLNELGSERDHASVAADLDARFMALQFEGPPPVGFWSGRAGMLAVAERLAPDAGRRDLLHQVLAGNSANPAIEVMWGAPGSMLVAAAMLERTGEQRWAEVWLRLAESVWGSWEHDEELGFRIWTQLLYGSVAKYISPAHGFAGNVRALAGRPELLGNARMEELARDAVKTATATAIVEDGLANWRPLANMPLRPRPEQEIRTQWCHGSPGVVATLAGIAPDDDDFTQLLIAGGELTWTAGPLTKGASLCHGTAGNGLAFLALHERTGEEIWLERARRFGMHAIEQIEAARSQYGRGRYTLWTGDVGTALYLRTCIDPAARLGIDIGAW